MELAKRGDRVSLNTLQRLFYFQEGVGGISLREGDMETSVIPENATDHQLDQINHAIRNNQLTVGYAEKPVEPMERDSDIVSLLELGRNKVEEWMLNMRDNKSIKNDVKINRIEKIVELEKSGKNRKSLLSKAEQILSYIGGVSPVVETEQEKLEIKLTSGSDEVEAST